MDPQDWLDRGEANLDRLLDAGEMTPEDHAKEVRALRREYREMAREAAEEAHATELDKWFD